MNRERKKKIQEQKEEVRSYLGKKAAEIIDDNEDMD